MSQESDGPKKNNGDRNSSANRFGFLIVPISSALVLAVVAMSFVQLSRTRPGETDKQREIRERSEKYSRESKERQETSERERKARQQEYLQKQKDAFEKAKAAKSENVAAYINAELNLAFAYRSNEENRNADAAFADAYSLFINPDTKLNGYFRADQIWRYLPNLELNDAQLETKFREIFTACARRPDGQFTSVISSAITSGAGRNGSSDNGLKRKLAQIAIEMTDARFGPNSEYLYSFLLQDATLCEHDGDLVEAEKQYLRAYSLNRDNTPDGKVSQQLNLAEFFLRHGMPDKAQAAFNNAEKACGGTVSQNVARRFSSYLQSYIRNGKGPDIDNLISRMLAMGGDAMCRELDPKVHSLVNDYIDSGALKKAEVLLRKRVTASETCSSDPSANDWRIKLSEVLLALGKESESNQIYNEVKNAVALQGGSVDVLVEQRAALLDRLGKSSQSAALKKHLPKSTLSPPNTPVTLKYGLLSSEMRFGHNTSINSFGSRGRERRAMESGVDICCLGPLMREGNFNCRGTVYVSSLVPNTVSPLSVGRDQTVPIDPKDVVIQPAITPPSSAIDLRNKSYSVPGRYLEPGDYIVSDLRALTNRIRPGKDSGRLRLFLVDDVRAPIGSDFDLSGILRSPYGNPENFQIWYGGTRTLNMRGWAAALIYAPKAVVELPFNGSMSGAIVARRIVGAGNNQFNLDPSLIGKTFSTSE